MESHTKLSVVFFLRESDTRWFGKWGGEDDRTKERSRDLMLLKYSKADIVHQALLTPSSRACHINHLCYHSNWAYQLYYNYLSASRLLTLDHMLSESCILIAYYQSYTKQRKRRPSLRIRSNHMWIMKKPVLRSMHSLFIYINQRRSDSSVSGPLYTSESIKVLTIQRAFVCMDYGLQILAKENKVFLKYLSIHLKKK